MITRSLRPCRLAGERKRRRADVDHHRLARPRRATPRPSRSAAARRARSAEIAAKGGSSRSLTAPPWTRVTFPSRASRARSRRTVISDTAKRCARSTTSTPRPLRTASRINPRRCAGSISAPSPKRSYSVRQCVGNARHAGTVSRLTSGAGVERVHPWPRGPAASVVRRSFARVRAGTRFAKGTPNDFDRSERIFVARGEEVT